MEDVTCLLGRVARWGIRSVYTGVYLQARDTERLFAGGLGAGTKAICTKSQKDPPSSVHGLHVARKHARP